MTLREKQISAKGVKIQNENWVVTIHFSEIMGPLQLTVTWYKLHLAGEQATHWDIQNKRNSNLS